MGTFAVQRRGIRLGDLQRPVTAEGRVTPVIQREYGFDRASAALAHLEAGHTVGKVIVRGA